MARRWRRRKPKTIGKDLRRMARGLVYLGIAAALFAIIAGVGGQLANNLNFDLTISNTTYTVPLGSVANAVIGVAGFLMLLRGVRETGGIRI
jgi:heme/copper-type cytochrome/quinol oxidase subunit 1